MIVHHVDATTTLADREALAQWLGLSERTIRRHCGPAIAGHDPATNRVLYDTDRAATLLEAVVARPTQRLT